MFGMMFAAGATIGDVGAIGDGGGDGGDVDQSGSDAGDTGDAGDDSSSGDDAGSSQDDASDADAVAGDSQDAGDNIDPNAPVDLGDGRQVPGKFKKLFDLAKKAGVEKEAKQLYFANQRLLKAIPGGVNAAIQLAKDIDELGGVEGVEQLQSDIETYKSDAELFNKADPSWVASGFEENPDASLKLFAHTLDYVGEHHPEHYDHLMAKVIVNDLGALDIRGMHAALAALKDNPEAQRLATQLADYYNSRFETSRKVPEKKATDAATRALTEREKSVEQREMNTRFADVNREVFPVLKAAVNKTLAAEAKVKGLDLQKLSKEYPAEWRNMLNEIQQEIKKAATKDQRFIDKYFALVKKGDLKRAAKAVNDKHEQVEPEITRRVMATYGVFRGKKANPADKGKGNANGNNNANANAQNQGWTRVAKRPENSAINWSKTTQAMQLDGKYILNDGKKVVVNY